MNRAIGRRHGRSQYERALYADVTCDPFSLKTFVARALPGKHSRSIQPISNIFSQFHCALTPRPKNRVPERV